MNQFSEIKRQRMKDLIMMEYSRGIAAKLLHLTPTSLEIIDNFEDYREISGI